MAKPAPKFIIISGYQTSDQSRSSFSVVATSTPTPSPDDLLFAQWQAELTSIIRFEAIEDPSQDFEEAWFRAICKIKAPKFKNVSFLKTREIDSNDLKSSCFHVWSKTKKVIGKC